MNTEEFNHLQNQIDDLQNRVSHTEQYVAGFQHATCPCERAENSSCRRCISHAINQIKP